MRLKLSQVYLDEILCLLTVGSDGMIFFPEFCKDEIYEIFDETKFFILENGTRYRAEIWYGLRVTLIPLSENFTILSDT